MRTAVPRHRDRVLISGREGERGIQGTQGGLQDHAGKWCLICSEVRGTVCLLYMVMATIVMEVWIVRKKGVEEQVRENGREGEGDGEKGRMVRLGAVTQASAMMGLLCSVSCGSEGHPTPLSSVPNRGRNSLYVQDITEFSGSLSCPS